MPQLVNWELIKNPVNWIIVALMLGIAAFGLCLVMQGGNPTTILTGSTSDSL